MAVPSPITLAVLGCWPKRGLISIAFEFLSAATVVPMSAAKAPAFNVCRKINLWSSVCQGGCVFGSMTNEEGFKPVAKTLFLSSPKLGASSERIDGASGKFNEQELDVRTVPADVVSVDSSSLLSGDGHSLLSDAISWPLTN